LSSPPVTTRHPSGLNAAVRTPSVCPLKATSSAPVPAGVSPYGSSRTAPTA
jgi:hypothetical protein